MKNVLGICTTHRGIMKQTLACMKAANVNYLEMEGTADIAAGRCLSLDGGLAYADANPEVDTFLMFDDDMVFSPETVSQLVHYSQILKHPVSAIYVLSNFAAAASPYADVPVVGEPWMSRRWLCGLGLMAMPVKTIRELKTKSSCVSANDLTMTAFTWTGEEPGESAWYSEDTRLCKRLGGAILAPLAAGHLKMQELRPNGSSIERIRQGLGFVYKEDVSQ